MFRKRLVDVNFQKLVGTILDGCMRPVCLKVSVKFKEEKDPKTSHLKGTYNTRRSIWSPVPITVGTEVGRALKLELCVL